MFKAAILPAGRDDDGIGGTSILTIAENSCSLLIELVSMCCSPRGPVRL